MRLFGIPESEIANTLRAAESEGIALEQLEITTCLRRGEIEIATRFEPPAAPVYDRFLEFVATRHADTLFSRDGTTSTSRSPPCSPRRRRPWRWPSRAPAG